MLVSSLYFMMLFPFLLLLYYKLPTKARPWFLLLLSYAMYLYSGAPYILFLLFSTVLTYFCGRMLAKASGNNRNILLAVTILANLAVLVFFKYFNTLPLGAEKVLETLHFNIGVGETSVKLFAPLGISFYTFQTIGYVADVYTGKIEAEQNFFTYALFVSFFPQIAMGPINRAGSLIPQFETEKPFVYKDVTDGLRQMAIGFFKKFAVADILAIYVNGVFGNAEYTGLVLTFAAVLYTFQIYTDFSGYSDIAIGCAKTFGIQMADNFKTPLFATSVTTFWNRWHISLSTWFRDYIYIPLGGSRKGTLRYFINLTVVFLVSGIWHGDTLNFLIWGALHAAFRVAEAAVQKVRGKKEEEPKNLLIRILKNLYTFAVVCFAFVFFRAATLQDALHIITKQFSGISFSALPAQIYGLVATGFDNTPILVYGFIAFTVLTLMLLFVIDWYTCFKLNNGSLAHNVGTWKPAVRWVCYYGLMLVIFAAFLMQNGGFGGAGSFIYNQF